VATCDQREVPQRTTDDIAADFDADKLKAIVEAANKPRPDPQALEAAVNAAFDQGAKRETDVIKVANRVYGVFKVLSDEKKGRGKWQWLRTKVAGLERDRVVFGLWHALEAKYGLQVELLGGSVSYHRAWLFDWFFGRYDLRRGRMVAGGGRWAENSHLLLALVVGSLFVLRRTTPLSRSPAWWSILGVGLAYAVAVGVLAWSFHGKLEGFLEPAVLALQSLLPRLAGASAVGLVLLTSSQGLLSLVVTTLGWWRLALPLAAGYIYLLLEMARRVHPLPRLRRLALRGLDICATALCHGMALTLVAERGLRKILGAKSVGPFELQAAASVAVSIFIIGLVVNLIWAEKPVTEPL
jgi:hypothetical protein